MNNQALAELDINSHEFLNEPYDQLSKLQKISSVTYVESLPVPAYVVVGHEDVRLSLNSSLLVRDPRCWKFGDPNMFSGYKSLDWSFNNSPLINAEIHQYHRKIFAGAMKPSVIRKMEGLIRHVVSRHTACFKSGSFDVIAEMDLIAFNAMIEILGLGGRLSDGFAENAKAFIDGTTSLILDDGGKEKANKGCEYIEREIRSLINDHEHEPDTLIYEMIGIRSVDSSISEDHVVLSLMAMLAAGAHATTHVVGLAMMTLARHPLFLEELRADRSLLNNAADELLRFTGPSKFLVRFSTEDLEIGGVGVPRGEMVLLSLGAANKDPIVFPQSTVLDIHRDNLGSVVTFGSGQHYCTGVHIAKTIIRSVIGDLLDMTSGPITEVETLWVHDEFDIMWRKIKSLLIEVAPAADGAHAAK